MAQLWNDHGWGYRLNLEAGAHQIKMALERNAKMADIEALIYDKARCSGKKIWEALEPLIPAGDNGTVDFLKQAYDKFLKG